MISSTLLLVIAAITFLIYYLFLKKPKWTNSPPGPKGLPFFGNLFQLDKFQHRSFCKWAEAHGPIYKVDLATTRMVVVSDYKLVKEIFSDPNFSGRMDFSLFDIIPDGKVHGIINTEGTHWEELRRFTLRQLRDFGFGKNTMEELIMIEVNELIEELVAEEGKSVSEVKSRLMIAVVNSLWKICVNKRYSQKDKEIVNTIETANEAFNCLLEEGSLVIFAPWLAKIFPKWSGYSKIRKNILNLAEMYRKPVKEHFKTYSEDFERDFTDTFIKEIRNTKNPDSAFFGKYGEDNLVATLSDLYFAGTDTTSTTLSWMILYLSKMPEIQKNFFDEIKEITGNTRSCSVADRPQMPYTEALLAEVLRFSSIAAVGVQHRALKDTTFKNYTIPKDTVITSNLYYIHHDPKVWGDPEHFRPERFLSSDGKTFKKHDALIPFSVGKRQCLGETLARDSLFLFATNIFQRFSIEFDKNGPDNGFEPKVSFVITPLPFNVIFKERN